MFAVHARRPPAALFGDACHNSRRSTAVVVRKLVAGDVDSSGQTRCRNRIRNWQPVARKQSIASSFDHRVEYLFTGPVGFYLSTASYFHLMEVLGRPAGFKLPPSFNYPLGRENISAFWMNWNMTATFLFRDYLFYNRWGRRTYNIYFNTVLLFTLVGLWHAANAYWILWGFLHGLSFCVFLLWRKYNGRLGRYPFARHRAVQNGFPCADLRGGLYRLVSAFKNHSKAARRALLRGVGKEE